MRKHLFTLIVLSALFLVPFTAKATDYTVPSGSPVASWALPLYMGNTTSSAGNFYGSITQQIYLAEDLIAQEASAGNITDITFYYTSRSGYTASAITPRTIAIYLMESDVDEYPMYNFPYQDIYDNTQDKYLSYFLCDDDNKAGVKVFEGSLATEEVTSPTVKEVKLTFNVNNFAWSGTKNIIMTLVDKSATSHTSSNLRFQIVSTQTDAGTVNHPRFLDTYWTTSSDERAGWINTTSDIYNFSSKLGEYYGQFKVSNLTESEQKRQRSYVPKVTFSISPAVAPVVPATPTGLAASNIGVATASLSWTAVDGAVSYALYSSVDDETYTELATPSTNSYDWTGLSANSTYYVKVAAVNAAGSSDFSAPISFTTLAPHIHDGISFEPWSNPSALPTSGNYYLANDVMLDPYDPTTITLTGNLNLCLNGHTANVYGTHIVVPDSKTLAIYDNIGGGKLTGFVASEVGISDLFSKALIVVHSGGFLELYQGTIENTYEPDEDGSSYAIYSNGTLHLSGDVLINSNNTDIYLYSTNVIILDGAISNAEKHKVYKMGGDITYGWSTYMSGEDPRDYFESSNSARAVFLDDDEAALRILLRLSENSNNSSIADNRDIVVDVALTRSLTSSQYNTFCLPFNLNNAQLEAIFGVGYDLEQFDHSNFDGETLELAFVRRYELTEGQPYLIKPSVDVVNPYFEGVTIYDGNPGSDEFDAHIYFYGTFGPTSLEGGNKNLLFLGANDELFWPEATGNIKGFRAYFEVQAGSPARRAIRACINTRNTPTGIENQKSQITNQKFLKDGQLFIIRDNKTYNVLGIECK